jgi:serine phosphatase RsbU (regulator of sigma subunit)
LKESPTRALRLLSRRAPAGELLAGQRRVSVSTFVRPISSVCEGGAFAQSFLLPDGATAVAIGHCSGRGRDATSNALLLHAAVQSQLFVGQQTLSRSAATISRLLFKRVEQGTIPWPFVRLFMGIIEPSGHSLRYVSCGHDAALVFRGLAAHDHLRTNSAVMGLSAEASFVEDSAAFGQFDTLVVATSGFTDARPLNADDQFFGTDGLCSAFLDMRRISGGVEDSVDAAVLMRYAENFSDGSLDDDAATLIASCS